MGRRAGHWIRCRVYQTRDCRIRRCSGRATRAAKLDRYSNFLALAGFGELSQVMKERICSFFSPRAFQFQLSGSCLKEHLFDLWMLVQ